MNKMYLVELEKNDGTSTVVGVVDGTFGDGLAFDLCEHSEPCSRYEMVTEFPDVVKVPLEDKSGWFKITPLTLEREPNGGCMYLTGAELRKLVNREGE